MVLSIFEWQFYTGFTVRPFFNAKSHVSGVLVQWDFNPLYSGNPYTGTLENSEDPDTA